MKTTGLDQVRALSHPIRLRLLELFAAKPRTTKQAAEVLGEAPTRLYHHVAALARAGLIRLRETRQNRGTTEKYYEAAAHRFIAGADQLEDPEVKRDLASMGMLVFEQGRNELARALANERVPEGLMAVRGVFQLSETAAKKLRKELTDVIARLRQDDKPSRGKRRRYALTMALIPSDDQSMS